MRSWWSWWRLLFENLRSAWRTVWQKQLFDSRYRVWKSNCNTTNGFLAPYWASLALASSKFILRVLVHCITGFWLLTWDKGSLCEVYTHASIFYISIYIYLSIYLSISLSLYIYIYIAKSPRKLTYIYIYVNKDKHGWRRMKAWNFGPRAEAQCFLCWGRTDIRHIRSHAWVWTGMCWNIRRGRRNVLPWDFRISIRIGTTFIVSIRTIRITRVVRPGRLIIGIIILLLFGLQRGEINGSKFYMPNILIYIYIIMLLMCMETTIYITVNMFSESLHV